ASLGQATQAIDRAMERLHPPPALHASFQGAAREFGQSLQSEGWLVLAAIIAVYIVLGVLYESFLHPLTILSTLPSAGVGALLALMMFHTEFSVIALNSVWNIIKIGRAHV